jgi:F-type H+-transporting ATPase subunit delta
VKKKITNKQLAVGLYEAARGVKPSDFDKILDNFVGLLFKNRKLRKSEYVIKEYIKYSKIQEGINEIEITSARELDEKVVNAIKKTFGAKTEAKVKVDEDLIGGIKIRTEDKILDASIRTQLTKLKQAIS